MVGRSTKACVPVIQSALFFLLGVLVAVFFVILLGPTVWRRALYLAKRQVQVGLPMTLAEIRADKDGLRAEYAATIARLEQKLQQVGAAQAEQSVVIGRQYEELKQIPVIAAERDESMRERNAMRDACDAMETERNAALEKSEILKAELERLQSHFNALEELADTLRVEISGYETNQAKLTRELAEMRRDRKDAANRYNELSIQVTSAQTELKNEKRRNDELQQKLERLISQLSDAEEKLERQSRRSGAVGAGSAEELTAIAQQNAALREAMAEMAARMVAVTAEKEGPDSPIHAILAADKRDSGKAEGDNKSLASRIEDFQKA